MNAREERAIARLERAALRLRVMVQLAPARARYERYVSALEASAIRLRKLAIEQYQFQPQLKVEGTKTARLRERLRREYMIPLSRVGRRLLRFAPGIERALKVPHARASHRELVTTAEVMLKAVRPYQKLLIAADFPKTFLGEFREVTRELKRIATTSSTRQANFARVTRELREELANANDTLRILDGLVLGIADRDQEFARAWKETLRTPKPRGRPRKKKRKLSLTEAGGTGEEQSVAV